MVSLSWLPSVAEPDRGTGRYGGGGGGGGGPPWQLVADGDPAVRTTRGKGARRPPTPGAFGG
eukprot:7267587-Alexandrium_andersonii.AAC.1